MNNIRLQLTYESARRLRSLGYAMSADSADKFNAYFPTIYAARWQIVREVAEHLWISDTLPGATDA
jgi:hypothetical protein